MLLSRRRWLEVGGLSLLGLTWADRLRGDDARGSAPSLNRVQRGHARACVVIFLWGGPGQQDLWDLKPAAPAEIRGEFTPIATSVPGLHLGSGLPHLAQQAHRFSIVRSVTHRDFEHGTAAYTALTGHPHPNPGTNTPARPEDFPTYASVVSRLRPGPRGLPTAMVLGPVMHQGSRPPIAGQNAGFLGRSHDAFRIADDPSDPNFQVESLRPVADVSGQRLQRRQSLLQSLHQANARLTDYAMDDHYRQAFDLLDSNRVRQAFAMSQEPAQIRDRYGPGKFGQTLLLARRLLEVGVPFLTVNWGRQNGDQWDTHRANYPRLRQLLPPFDRGLAAFLEDLDERGLLDSTLVYCLGEFGRTPRMNVDAGRDHWPDCYSVLLAGGGFRRGEVIGASDRFAAYPTEQPMAPWDLAATLYHRLGLDPASHLNDPQGRAWLLSTGQVRHDLLAGR